MLPGEDPAKISREELTARIVERDRQLRRRAKSVWDLSFTDYVKAARAAFDTPALPEVPRSE